METDLRISDFLGPLLRNQFRAPICPCQGPPKNLNAHETECWKWSVEYWAGSAHYSVSPPTHAAVVSPTRKRMNRRMLISSPSCLATPATCYLTVISEFLFTKPWSSRQLVWKNFSSLPSTILATTCGGLFLTCSNAISFSFARMAG